MNLRSMLKFLFGSEKPNKPPIDLERLAAIMCEDDNKFLFSILQKFVEKFPPLLNSLETAIEECDARSVRDRAHAAKGTARGVGAHDLSEILEGIETCDHLDNWDETKTQFGAARSEFARIIAFYENRD
jgi:HPt (histidine-containing phosphotransfer) domain-containing protein